MPKVSISEDFLCPITHELMTDPVATADGQIYERKAIAQWLQEHNTSPLTNEKLAHKILTVIPFVKKQIQSYLEKTKVCTATEFLEVVKSGNVKQIEQLNYLDSYLEIQDDEYGQ